MVSKDCDRVYLAKDKDFKFIEFDRGYEVDGKGIGYFQYIGKENVVKIPHIIQDHKLTSYAWMFCNTSIREVVSTNKDITNLSYMFYEVKTDKLILYDFDTSNVTDISCMFSESNIDKLDLNYFDTSNVIEMNWLFSNSNIRNLNISNLNTENVRDMRGMFLKLETNSLDLSSFNTKKVINMAGMFMGTEAQDLDLSTFDIGKTTIIYNMFKYVKAKTVLIKRKEYIDRFNLEKWILANTAFKVKEGCCG